MQRIRLEKHFPNLFRVILFLLMLISASVFPKALMYSAQQTSATIYVSPSPITAAVGQKFSINITIADVFDLYGWEFKLGWNSTLLDVTNVAEGSFLKQGGSTFFTFQENDTSGFILVDCTLLGDLSGVGGNGILAIAEFCVKDSGESLLDIYDTILISSTELPIIHESVDGYGYFTPSHDVAVIGIIVSPTITLPDQIICINVTVENQGVYGENFNVTTYYDSVLIEKQLVSLNQGQRIVLNFTWDTTGVGKGDYKILAEASEVPGEIDTTDNTKIADSIITILSLGHDVAIKAVIPSKTVVGQGYSLFINITTKNYGSFTETFNVTAYCNNTTITQPNGKNYITITLTSGNSTIVIYTWNTSGFAKGNYTIWAYAWPVLGETHTADNTLVNGWIIVSMVGDVTGPDGWPDGKCDMIYDIRSVAKLFGVAPPDPRYNPNYDVNGDGKIDMINDIRTVAKQFGKTDP